MKYHLRTDSTLRFVFSLALTACLALPLAAQASSITLATSPLATSTTSTVMPNVMFLLDNSGSMNWEHMPDDSGDDGSSVTFTYGYYGLRSSQCNQVYYDPNTTYLPPVDATGAAYTDASFTNARVNGYSTAACTAGTCTNLDTGYKASLPASYTYVAGDTLGQSAYYYKYSGSQLSQQQKNYNSTTNTFYSECNNSTGSSVSAIAPASGVGGVFTKQRYATTETTTITVSSSTANATFTITVGGGTTTTTVSSITVGGTTITSGSASASTSTSTAATAIKNKITANGYSASSSGAVITVTGPASVGATITINQSGGNFTFAKSAISPLSVVSGITVNGAQLMLSGSATIDSSTSTTATNIAANITAAGYSANASGSTVTISGPTSAANYAPVITYTGSITLAADVFPDTSAAKLTNFANWYSFYRTRMLMMKTAAGRAFKTLDNHYRVGFTKLSSSATPTRYLDTFETTNRTNWYSSLYGTTASGSTPLREALANAGRYYAGQLSGADPVQYSCQQNFTIMSTDGFWNGNAGFMVDGSTDVANQDGTAARPMYDGASGATKVTTSYTRDNYSVSSSAPGCTKKKLKRQPEKTTCSITTVSGVAGPETCNTWTTDGLPVYSGLCNNSITVTASPNPTARVQSGTPVTTTTTVGGTSDTLADVAMYYYQTDLRTSTLNNCTGALGGTIDVCENNVFKTDTDGNTAQHMATFTLGMGASGKMNYSPSYLTDTSGDYYSVWKGSTTNLTATPKICSWQTSGACNWPFPGMDGSGNGYIENIDDLWHAAVNGHGQYFSATSPTSLASGLSNALAAIASRKGSSAAAATSTLNPVAGNNYAYVASYTTVKWQGNLEARTINTSSGEISQAATWCVETLVSDVCPAPGNIVADSSSGSTIYNCVISGSNATDCAAPNVFDVSTSECRSPQLTQSCVGTMPGMVGASSDTRNIKTANSTGTALIDFDAAYATANPTNFAAAHINTLSQWTSLTATQKTAAEGVNLLNFLRGQTGYEDRAINLVGAVDNRLYRYRESTLGDALESQPIFISKPVFSYADPGYSDYATLKAGRVGTVFMGTNDGMLHAFAAKDESTATPPDVGGKERWAYVPSMVIPNMWKLADKDYATKHTNFVNGSPIISDVCTANCTDSATAVWKTILVGGLNAGGRGYYALDITVPATPTLLWEFTTANDSDMGYSYGNPVITAKSDGTWVVLLTSGYNNTSTGNGQGYLYVLNAGTGAIISKMGTGVGSTTTPSGLGKISAWNDVPASNRATFVYGGDLLGNVWRFDINTAGTPFLFATLLDPSGNPQPVTTAPVLGKIGGKRVIFVGTGKYLETSDLTNTQKQTLYAIKDDNETVTLSNPAGSPRVSTTLVQQTLTEGNGVRTASNNPVNFSTGRGWYVDFPDSGERSNIESRLVQGTLLIATIVPSNTVCSPGGYGWLNFFDYQSGSSIDTSAIVSAKYDNTIVGINVLYIDGKPVVETVTSNDPTPKVNDDVLIHGTATGFTGKRVLWRELNP